MSDETLRQVMSELALLRRVVARHIADGRDSGVPAAEVLAGSLETEIEMAGLRLDGPEAMESRLCGRCGRVTAHWVTGDGCGQCAVCRAAKNRYDAAA